MNLLISEPSSACLANESVGWNIGLVCSLNISLAFFPGFFPGKVNLRDFILAAARPWFSRSPMMELTVHLWLSKWNRYSNQINFFKYNFLTSVIVQHTWDYGSDNFLSLLSIRVDTSLCDLNVDGPFEVSEVYPSLWFRESKKNVVLFTAFISNSFISVTLN